MCVCICALTCTNMTSVEICCSFYCPSKLRGTHEICLFVLWRIQLRQEFCVISHWNSSKIALAHSILPPCGNYPENKHLLNIHLIHFVLKPICIRQKHRNWVGSDKNAIQNLHNSTHSNWQRYVPRQKFIFHLFCEPCIDQPIHSSSNGINLHAFEVQRKMKYVFF